MISLQEAQALVESQLAKLEMLPDGDSWAIVQGATIEREFGWVFFFSSRAFLETKNPSYAVAGIGPILVNRRTGTFEHFGSAYPAEHYIAKYEQSILHAGGSDSSNVKPK